MERPSDDLIARFRTDYERLLTPAEPPDHRIALAVSGGPDSMAMLGLAAAAFPGRVIAATVDHGLRPASSDEAAMVARVCVERGVAHATLKIARPRGASDNLQVWARRERYLLLEQWANEASAPILCTAHHADDQAETFLMRATRASGLSGLAAIRARVATDGAIGGERQEDPGCYVRNPISLMRPLLHWRRHELRAVAEAMRLPVVHDPSNHDPRFDRARFRALLADAPWIDPLQIGRTAENLAALDADLREMSDWLWKTRQLEGGDDISGSDVRVDVANLPRGVKRYLARSAIDAVLRLNGMGSRGWTSSSNIEALLDALDAGHAATQARILISASGTVWHFRVAPPRRSE